MPAIEHAPAAAAGSVPTASVNSAALAPTAAVVSTPTATAPAPSAATPLATVLNAVSGVLGFMADPAMNTNPQTPPVNQPLAWTMLAAARRQIGQAEPAPSTAAAVVQSSQTTTGAAPASALTTTANSQASTAAAAAGPTAPVLPTGGVTVAGAATLTNNFNQLVINQTSPRAIVDFRTFNLDANSTVTITQPTSTSVLLIQANGGPAQIAGGTIQSNGRVILVDRSGMTVSPGAQIDTIGGVVLSTAGFAFPADLGSNSFNAPGDPLAVITMDGTIKAGRGGLVALLAPQVVVGGTIDEPDGAVDVLGAVTAAHLPWSGAVTLNSANAVKRIAKGQSSLVTVSGAINAPGSTVRIEGMAAAGVIKQVVRIPGTVQATTVGTRRGQILVTGVGGNVGVGGSLLAEGDLGGPVGGKIQVDASGTVALGTTADLSVDGPAGGGVIAVGTTLQRAQSGPGGTATLTAQNVVIPKGATLDANATSKGNGGRVSVLSSGVTDFSGAITARGGPSGGNGGFVETSGATLNVTGTVNVTAPKGTVGTWLLDPSGKTSTATVTAASVTSQPTNPPVLSAFGLAPQFAPSPQAPPANSPLACTVLAAAGPQIGQPTADSSSGATPQQSSQTAGALTAGPTAAANSQAAATTTAATTTATINVGLEPHGVAVSLDGSRVYVANVGDNTVSVIDTATNTLIGPAINVGASPEALVLGPNGSRLYVANTGDNTVSVIDTAANTVIGPAIKVGASPVALAPDASGIWVYVANSGDGTVSVIDTTNNTVSSKATVGGSPTGVAAGPNGAYVTNTDGTVSQIDMFGRVLAKISVSASLDAVTVATNGTHLYVTDAGHGTVSLFDPFNPVIHTVKVGALPIALALSPDGSRVYVTNQDDNTVSVINTAANTIIGTPIPVGGGPDAVAVSPDGTRIYVTNLRSDTVSVINTATISDVPTADAQGPVSVNPSTGAVTGTAGFTDPAGLPLSYTATATASPAEGTVTIDAAGQFAYTPPRAARLAAAAPTPVNATFTVTASNGVEAASETVTVTVPPPTVTTTKVGGGPDAVAVSPDGTRTYVVNAQSNTVSVIDTATNTAIGAPIRVGLTPQAVAISPDGRRVYVANTGANTVSVLNTGTNKVIATIKVATNPMAVAVSPDGSRLYVADTGANRISIINTATNTVSRTLRSRQPQALAFSPDGSRLYVTHLGSNTVTVMDTATKTAIGTPIPVGAAPRAVAVSPDGTVLYVANLGANTVSVIDTATRKVGATIAVGANPYGVAVSPDGTLAYVTNESANTVSVINTATHTVLATIAVGQTPLGITISPDGYHIYVTDANSGSVSVISLGNPSSGGANAA
ncbi:MAG TPA: beta-propeller fold lactonase family protein [Mycobacterium sp.]|nr:beta-propeller fold lactonase family protein [Mycobacterium sp.]